MGEVADLGAMVVAKAAPHRVVGLEAPVAAVLVAAVRDWGEAAAVAVCSRRAQSCGGFHAFSASITQSTRADRPARARR